MLTNEQIELRQSGIGGSEAAIPLGLSTRMTARELYHVKRGEIEPLISYGEDLPWLGHRVESVLIDWYTEQTGWKVRRPKDTARHRDLPWMLAHYDGRVVGLRGPNRRGLELKYRVRTEGWGPAGSDQIPDAERLQCLHYMAVSRLPLWDLVVWLPGEFRRYTIPRDEPTIDAMIAAESEFIYALRAGNPPSVDWTHPTALALIQRLHPGTDGAAIDLHPSAAHWAATLSDAKGQISTYKAIADGAEAHLRAMMGYAAIGFLPDGSAFHRKTVSRGAYAVDATRYETLTHKRAPR